MVSSEQRIAQLEMQYAQLAQQNFQLTTQNSQLVQRNTVLSQLLGQAQTRIAELERQVGRHSGNSGQPPSSDGPRKPPARSQRRPSTRSPGGQPGHLGTTLRATAEPDVVEIHQPSHCASCGRALDPATAVCTWQSRQVFDLPAPPPLCVTEHRRYV